MTRYIQDYIELVRSGTVPVCRDQLLLVDYVERVFQEESIYVDEAQLERYMDQQKYFPYRLLESWGAEPGKTAILPSRIFV